VTADVPLRDQIKGRVSLHAIRNPVNDELVVAAVARFFGPVLATKETAR
jgi:hypothetical protein